MLIQCLVVLILCFTLHDSDTARITYESDNARQLTKDVTSRTSKYGFGVCLEEKWSALGEQSDFLHIECKDGEERFKGCCYKTCASLVGEPSSHRLGSNECQTSNGTKVGEVSLTYPCGSFGRSLDSRCCAKRRLCLERAAGGTEDPDSTTGELSYQQKLLVNCREDCGKVLYGGMRLGSSSICGKTCRKKPAEGTTCVFNRFGHGGHRFILRRSGVQYNLDEGITQCFNSSENELVLWRRRKTRDGVIQGPKFWVNSEWSASDLVLEAPRLGDKTFIFEGTTERTKYAAVWIERPKTVKEHQLHHTDWMGELFAADPTLKLRDLCIPGSHDSGASYLFHRKFRGFAKHILGNHDLIASLSKTQDLTILEQLAVGIRYFDFRVDMFKRPHESFFLHHGGVRAIPLTQALAEIRAFLEWHPKEIILVDFQEIPKCKETVGKLRSEIFRWLWPLPSSLGVNISIRDIWDSGRNVILFWDQADMKRWEEKDNLYLWPFVKVENATGRRAGGTLESAWGRTSTTRELSDHVLFEVASMNRSEVFHVSQMILTPVPGKILTSGGLHSRFSVRQSQKDLNLASLTYVADAQSRRLIGRGVNIVMTDFVQEHQVVDTCVDLNWRLVRDSRKRIVERMETYLVERQKHASDNSGTNDCPLVGEENATWIVVSPSSDKPRGTVLKSSADIRVLKTWGDCFALYKTTAGEVGVAKLFNSSDGVEQLLVSTTAEPSSPVVQIASEDSEMAALRERAEKAEEILKKLQRRLKDTQATSISGQNLLLSQTARPSQEATPLPTSGQTLEPTAEVEPTALHRRRVPSQHALPLPTSARDSMDTLFGPAEEVTPEPTSTPTIRPTPEPTGNVEPLATPGPSLRNYGRRRRSTTIAPH